MLTKTLKRTAVAVCVTAALGMSIVPEQAHAQGYTETRYPIVLVHGLAGYDRIGLLHYFNGIPETLERYGADVHVVQVAAANATEIRGEQLLEQVEEIIAITGAGKVNLIGHSHGSMTARYVAGVRPDLVASVSSVGGVNWGSAMADLVESNRLATGMVDVVARLIDLMSGGGFDQDTAAAARQMSTRGAVVFNQQFPAGIPSTYCGHDAAHEVDGVRYYSWGGDRHVTNLLDPSDALLLMTGTLFGEPNDGVVSVCSQKLGQVTSVNYPMNHLDVVNRIGGLVGAGIPRPLTVWRQHANRLRNAGL